MSIQAVPGSSNSGPSDSLQTNSAKPKTQQQQPPVESEHNTAIKPTSETLQAERTQMPKITGIKDRSEFLDLIQNIDDRNLKPDQDSPKSDEDFGWGNWDDGWGNWQNSWNNFGKYTG